ncbi:MAG: shikimate kinase [Halanaerobiales bacterium]
MIITLIGFMGTGKSTVGQQLADRIGFGFYDIDDAIENSMKLSIPMIFDVFGEEYFRSQETEELLKVIKSDKDRVVATGGGIVIAPFNRKILKKKTEPVLLQASAEEIYKRVKDDKNRPLLDVADPRAEIARLMAKRIDYYEEFAIRINTDGCTVKEIVDKIIIKLGINL